MSPARMALTLIVALLALAGPAQARAGAVPATSKEREVVAAMNQIRAANALPPLRLAASLWRAARSHSRDMGAKGYFAHATLPSGESFSKRILRFQDRAGVRWLGENIGWGCGELSEPSEMVAMWMASPPHRRAILDRRFTMVGVGAWIGSFQGHPGARVFTADFGG